MASSTMVIEMLPSSLQPAARTSSKDQSIPLEETLSTTHTLSEEPRQSTNNVVRTRPRWNNPRINTWRLTAIYFGFINFGMMDASYGALIPYIEADYHLSYTVTSLVFLSPFVGYTLAALFSDRLHRLSGRRGIAFIAPACKIAACIVISTHPPYSAVVVVLAIAGLGNGLIDAAWNAWVGTMDHTNQLLGFLHGCYGLGATISPLIATTMVTKSHLGWWTFYYIMAGVDTLELIAGTAVFWAETSGKYCEENRHANGDEKGMTRLALKQKVTWICSAFLLAYVGTEVSLGGWIVTFMIRVRDGMPFSSGMTATGFWLGITLGRVSLGFLTPRLGERLAVSIYTVFAIGFELIFWLVPQFIVSAVAIALVGFFIGPLFPSTIMAATKLLPSNLHVAAIGFSSAVGGGGAAV
ncbi:hypothetical protein MMC28_002851 [Mycoblastus sanguinarius]|nr:hypothetical protein [Mycoblastus sanguinarius]